MTVDVPEMYGSRHSGHSMAEFNKNNALEHAGELPEDSSDGQHRAPTYKSDPWWKFGGKDRSFVPTHKAPSDSSINRLDEFENPADESVFNDPKVVEFYEPIENYEGRHRFDLKATWSEYEEKKLVRRVSIPSSSLVYNLKRMTADILTASLI